jgi:hypothetical protein
LAATIFDNSENDLTTRFNPGTSQVGDQIILATDSGLLADRSLTYFSFEYWGANSIHPSTFSGAIQARVEFYANDGTPTTMSSGYAPPGTSFYDSGWFSVPTPTNRATFVFTEGSLPGDFPVGGLWMPVASNMTWTVQFRHLGAGDSMGVDIYSPPTVGQDYPDYWQNDGSGWALLTNSVPMDFAVVMAATVPEPSTLALSVCGGLGLLIVARRFRRKQ